LIIVVISLICISIVIVAVMVVPSRGKGDSYGGGTSNDGGGVPSLPENAPPMTTTSPPPTSSSSSSASSSSQITSPPNNSGNVSPPAVNSTDAPSSPPPTATASTNSPTSRRPTTKPSTPSPCYYVDIIINHDKYPEDTSWTISQIIPSNNIIEQSPPGDAANQSRTVCLGRGLYNFTIYDVYEDGICCDWGIGNYTLVYRGNSSSGGEETVITSGAKFNASESTLFTIPILW
jgi:hypothetical protein